MIMLGAFIRVTNLVSFNRIIKSLPEILGAKKARLLKVNKEALQQGFDYVEEK